MLFFMYSPILSLSKKGKSLIQTFAVSSIKLLLKKINLEKTDWHQKQRLVAEYKLLRKFLWVYANDAIFMKKFY